MTKVKKNKAGWKPLRIEGALLNSGIEGLVGIEELTDYNLEPKKTLKKKGNSKNENQQESIIESSVENESSEKQRKRKLSAKKNKSTKKSRLQVTSNTKEEEIESSENESDNSEIENKSSFNSYVWSRLGVPEAVIKSLAEQNFDTPTSIQALTLAPAILGRRDILGAAETGSGKTLAFGIPIINGILELKKEENENNNKICDSSDENDEETCNEINSESGEEDIDDEINSESGEEDIDDEITSESSDEELEGEITSESSDEELDGEITSERSDAEVDDETEDTDNIGCVRVIDDIKFDNANGHMKPLYALILTPTRELAIQVKDHLTKAVKYTDIRIAVVVGGMAAVKQERILSKGPEIVIATPGRLWELINEGNPHLSQINSIKYLAIDETDRMLEKGHFKELHNILEKINTNERNVKQRQTFVFSATLTLIHDIPDYLQRKKQKNSNSRIYKITSGQKLQKVIAMLKVKNPKIVDVTKQTGTASSLTECRIACTIDHKDYYLYYFLKRYNGRTLVFCNSIGCVRRLATLFGILGCHPLPLHASMQQRQRLKNLESFQADNNGLLIATNVAARGLDIPNVEHVIHYQVPRTSEIYIHRSGRTARAQKEGLTVLMMEPSEMQYYSRLCKTLGRTEDLPSFPVVNHLLIAIKERVNIAREIDQLELKNRRNSVAKNWLRKAVEDMDLMLDEDEMETTMDDEEHANLRRQLKAKRAILDKLISKPLFPKGFSGKYVDETLATSLAQNQKAVDVMKTAIKEKPKKYKIKQRTSNKK